MAANGSSWKVIPLLNVGCRMASGPADATPVILAGWREALRGEPPGVEAVLTAAEAGALRGVSPIYLPELIRAGVLKRHQEGRTSRIALGDPRHAWGDLQRPQHAAPPHHSTNAEGAPRRSLPDLATGDVRLDSRREEGEL